MRIVCISDTHSMEADIKRIPDGDVLIHAGDLTMHGEAAEILESIAWLSRLPHHRIILTPGNHDFEFQRAPDLTRTLREKFQRVEILIDQDTMIGDLRLWGSPWQPWFHNWAFNFRRGTAGAHEAQEKWNMIPDDTAILVTHGPVYGILDKTMAGQYVGCPHLRRRVETLSRLRLHVCGHIHEAHGAEMTNGVLFVNACSCDSQYWPSQPPIVVDLLGDVTRHVPWQEWAR